MDNNGSSNQSPGTASFDQKLEKAIEWQQKGAAGDRDAVRTAERAFKRLRTEHPDQPIVDAYFGSVLALLARDETKPKERLRLAKSALKLLDDAVARAPHDRTIRLLRGKVAYRLPEKYFSRTGTAIEDYKFLIEACQSDPSSLAPGIYQELLYELGAAYFRSDRQAEADSWWGKLMEQPDSHQYRGLIDQMKKGTNEKAGSRQSSRGSSKLQAVKTSLLGSVQQALLNERTGTTIVLLGASIISMGPRKFSKKFLSSLRKELLKR
ncbi:tetratricopeptide repeat protein [Cohnella faecalis]|uniref:Tetratricopeptide repeat protein n=1 Tax=Cohnella faecalis TaxID=2315694 RepID=A0A398CWQ9_9BACL|nr:hypothetical protein [Cohnella faecalis]RIE03454.1 hypothetical protein D3H35_12405 [Cohnella faecalis]